MEKRRAQAWGFDMMIALVLFILAVVIFYFYAINAKNTPQDTLQSMQYDAELAAEILLSEGHPTNWNTTNVVSPGLLTNGNINETKLVLFNTLASNTYARSKNLLQTRYNYFFLFSEPLVINTTLVSFIGQNTTNATNIIKTTRVTAYKNKPVVMNLYLWE